MYSSMRQAARSVLSSPAHKAGHQNQKTHQTASDVLSFPGGQWVLGMAGAVLVAVGLYQAYKGISRKFMEDTKTAEMSQTVRTWYERIGVTGYCGRAAVFILTGTLVIIGAVHDTA